MCGGRSSVGAVDGLEARCVLLSLGVAVGWAMMNLEIANTGQCLRRWRASLSPFANATLSSPVLLTWPKGPSSSAAAYYFISLVQSFSRSMPTPFGGCDDDGGSSTATTSTPVFSPTTVDIEREKHHVDSNG